MKLIKKQISHIKMINFKDIIFNQIKDQFKGANIELDELNITVNLKLNEGSVIAYKNKEIIFIESLEGKEFSTIQKLFVRKVISESSKKYPDFNIEQIFLQIDLKTNEYYIYLFAPKEDKKELIEFKL